MVSAGCPLPKYNFRWSRAKNTSSVLCTATNNVHKHLAFQGSRCQTVRIYFVIYLLMVLIGCWWPSPWKKAQYFLLVSCRLERWHFYGGGSKTKSTSLHFTFSSAQPLFFLSPPTFSFRQNFSAFFHATPCQVFPSFIGHTICGSASLHVELIPRELMNCAGGYSRCVMHGRAWRTRTVHWAVDTNLHCISPLLFINCAYIHRCISLNLWRAKREEC